VTHKKNHYPEPVSVSFHAACGVDPRCNFGYRRLAVSHFFCIHCSWVEMAKLKEKCVCRCKGQLLQSKTILNKYA